MLHNLGLAMAYHSFSFTDIPGFHWCAPCHPCREFRSAAYCREFWLFSPYFFAVTSIITLVECALPNISLLKGKPIQLAVPWASLSVSLNIILTAMICFRILRMRALTREILSPEMSKMYTSVAAMLIESAAPFSVLGIGLVVTSARKGPLIFAFGYVWTTFCVESKSSLPCSSL
jgi:hypothetical protein